MRPTVHTGHAPDNSPGRTAPDAPIDLRAARRRLGKTLREMAVEIGVSYRVLRAAEIGAVPREGNALKIAQFYGLDVVVQWPDPEPLREAA